MPSTATSVTAAAGTGVGPSTTEPNTSVERTVELTSFIDNQETIADQRPNAVPTMGMERLRQHHTEGTDIRKVGARPVFIQNITWPGTATYGALLSYIDLPLGILNASNIKLQKMQRYQFFSGDIVIRAQASAMAFQAGRLWVSFEAARNERGARRTNLTIQSVTSLDGIEFDPTVPNPVEFRVKYFSPVSEWDRIGTFGLGTVLFSVLSPLNSSSTATSVSFSVQAWFENLTFGVPTSDPFILSGPPTRNLERAFRQSHQERKQANREHAVSDALDTVSEIAGAIGTFPLLSAIAQPVSWATSMAARAARMFGFSKPDSPNGPTRMEIFPQSTAHFMDGASDAVSLTATSNFEMASGPVFGTEYDEMDIAYVCSRMPVVGAYNWDTTASIGQPIAFFPVMPGICPKASGAQNVSYGTYAPTPMAYVTSMFKYWAGAIKYRFEAVSTPFHAGRLLIAYVPDFDPFATVNITEIANNYSIVWDITTSNHIEFEVPYMSNTPYLETYIDELNVPALINGATTGTDARDRIRKCANGAIVMFVLNTLVAPSTASNTIQLLIWMGGGKDITFSEPTLGEFTASPARDNYDRSGEYYDGTVMVQPSTNFTVARAREIIDFPDTESDEDRPCFARRAIRQSLAPPQVGTDKNMAGSAQNDCNFENWMDMTYIDPMERAKMVTGECITNLRLLTRRLCPSYTIMPLNTTVAGALEVTPPTSNHVLCFDLDNFSSMSGVQDEAIYNCDAGSVVTPGVKWMYSTPTFLSYISYLYTYVRGTRRYMVTSRPSNIINGAPFTTGTVRLADSGGFSVLASDGEFDIRISNIVSNEQYTYFPWFRPEETILDYNNSNNSFATIASNYQFGLGSLYSSDAYVKRLGSKGTSLEVSAHSGTNMPIRLLGDADKIPSEFNALHKSNIPRKRRFLEIRYRPHCTAQKGVTANFPAIVWPIPTTIYEAAGDDLSFGYLQQPPYITRINQTHVFMNNDGTLTRL
jgi:hypothetical protein